MAEPMAEPINVSFSNSSELSHKLENEFGLSPIGWGSLVLNRTAERLSKKKMESKGIQHPQVGFVWNSDDATTSNWYPQGISGLRNSSGPKKFVVVSWYGKDSDKNKGARLSFVDVSDMGRVRYRHVLLVQSLATTRCFQPIKFHAGGIATRKNFLYIADTSYGIRVFNVARMYRTEEDPGKNRCGFHNGTAYAFDYRYILPQVGHYKLKGPPRFSYASMDHSRGKNEELILGNYHNPPATLAWWRMKGRHIGEGLRQVVTLPRRVQGAASHGDQIWLSCSGMSAKLKVAVYPFEQFRNYTWPHGCEDLHLSPYSGNLWCHTEHPGKRMVFAVKATDYEA